MLYGLVVQALREVFRVLNHFKYERPNKIFRSHTYSCLELKNRNLVFQFSISMQKWYQFPTLS